MKPITPKEAKSKKNQSIPAFVIECFNEAITEALDLNGRAVIQQEDILNRIIRHSEMPKAIGRQGVFDRGWLDVEPIFRQAGWIVEYDKPAYCETYEPTFTFKDKEKKKSRHES